MSPRAAALAHTCFNMMLEHVSTCPECSGQGPCVIQHAQTCAGVDPSLLSCPPALGMSSGAIARGSMLGKHHLTSTLLASSRGAEAQWQRQQQQQLQWSSFYYCY
eukprot:1157783-Pelagomonas_calceolata.AAC.5